MSWWRRRAAEARPARLRMGHVDWVYVVEQDVVEMHTRDAAGNRTTLTVPALEFLAMVEDATAVAEYVRLEKGIVREMKW